MRVTQQSMYTAMQYNMNSSLSNLMESNQQSATMKRINKPSDDPAGMAHILTYRADISKTEQYVKNSDMAEGWLTSAMGVLGSAEDTITQIQTLALQAADEHHTAEQRAIIAEEVRQLMGALLNMANTRHMGNSVFGGQNYGESAYDMGLGVTADTIGLDIATTGPALGVDFTVTGSIDDDTSVRFPDAGDIPPVGADLAYEWTDDGGKTWKTGTIPIGESSFKVGDATLTVPTGQTVTVAPYNEDTPLDGTGTTLNITSTDITFQASGSLDNTALVRFPEQAAGNPLRIPQPDAAAGGVPIEYEWTDDGGETWNTGTIPPGEDSFDVGSSIITIPQGKSTLIATYDPEAPPSDENGTQLCIRPTAIYNGYDDKAPPSVDRYGSEFIPSNIVSTTTGTISKDVLVQFPDGVDMERPGEYAYSYSTDGGRTWTIGTAEVKDDGPPTGPGDPGDTTMRLVIPGGYMDMDYDDTLPNGNPSADSRIPVGAQLIVKPPRTDLEYEITEDEYMSVTNVGKNIFGGMHSTPGSDDLEATYGGDERNLFETIGRLIGYLETDNTGGIGDCVADLKIAHKTLTTEATAIGGKRNRLDVNINLLESKKLNQNARKSVVEDINIAELTSKIAQQQLTLNSVLKSTSQIMQLSLLNYL